jgi:hypothetical protein
MAAKLNRLTHQIAIEMYLVAESCAIYSSRTRRPVGKLLDTPSYVLIFLLNIVNLFRTWKRRQHVLRNVASILLCFILQYASVFRIQYNEGQNYVQQRLCYKLEIVTYCMTIFMDVKRRWTISEHDIVLRRNSTYESVSRSFRTGRLERELQMIQISATKCNCIVILWVSLVSFGAITLCVASQRDCIVVSLHFVIDSVRKHFATPSYILTKRTVILSLLVLRLQATTTSYWLYRLYNFKWGRWANVIYRFSVNCNSYLVSSVMKEWLCLTILNGLGRKR